MNRCEGAGSITIDACRRHNRAWWSWDGGPAFELVDVVTGRAVGRDDVAATAAEVRGLLVMFICVHCPYVKHVEQELARIGVDYAGRIAIAAISSNDVAAYPEDSPGRR